MFRVTCLFSAIIFICVSGFSVRAEPLLTQLDRIFSEHNDMSKPGAGVILVQNGNTLAKAAFGSAELDSKTPVTTDTAFHLASVGKQMTAVAILKLQESGRLSVNDPVSKYLPQFKRWGDKIRISHLLHHTSGLYDYYEDIEETYPRPTNIQALKYLKSIAELNFRPGARFDYSNAGYDTLGALVEKASGMKFAAYMQSEIFLPAGMTNSYAFDTTRRSASKRAIGYELYRGQYYEDDTSPLNRLHGSGSIYASVEDLAKYDTALFGNEYISESSLRLMFTSGKLTNGRKTDYGFGWDILDDSEVGETYYGHSGGWMGFSTYYLHYPRLGLSVIVVANCSATDVETLAFSAGKAAAEAVR